jgi:hypothetical protein
MRNCNSTNLERVRKIKTQHQRLQGRLQGLREVMERYMGAWVMLCFAAPLTAQSFFFSSFLGSGCRTLANWSLHVFRPDVYHSPAAGWGSLQVTSDGLGQHLGTAHVQ